MKIQQHDGVVVDAAVTAAGFRPSSARGRGVAGEREAPKLQGAAALPPLLDIPSRGGGGPSGGNDPLRVSNQGGTCPLGGQRPLGFPTLGALGPWLGCTSPSGAGSHATSAHGALRDRWPHPVDPRDLPVVPIQYR